MDDLKRVRNNADGHELLAVVAALHHKATWGIRTCSRKSNSRSVPVNQSLNDRHLRLLELLLGVTAGGVGEVDSMADLDVVGKGDVLYLDTFLWRM